MSTLRRAVAVATACAAAALGTQVAAAQEPARFTISNITDFHGHIELVTDKNGNVTEPGAERLKCAVDRATAGKASAFVSSGDNVGGTPFVSAILDDAPTIDILNAMGLEATAVGNHEFDKGTADLRDRIMPESNFPTLGANVDGLDLPPYWIKEMDGVKVAFIGTVTDDTKNLVSPGLIDDVSFRDAVTVTNQLADELTASGAADVIVALIHEGAMETKTFSPNVDVVFAGHSHLEVPPTGTQPLVVQAGSYSKNLANVDLAYDRATDTVTVEKAEVLGVDQIADCLTPYPEIAALVQEAQAAADVEGSKVVAQSPAAFYRGKNEGGDSGSNRGVESTLNNLLAEVAKAGITKNTTVTADIGVMNAGGVRDDLPAGEITYKDAFSVQPFGNDITYTRLSGAAFKEALEQQWKDPAADRPVLSLGVSDNVSYTYDPKAPQGSRITSVTVDGQPIDPAKEYVVAGSTFLLGGGDNFKAFTKGTPLPSAGFIDVTAFNEYLAGTPDLAPRGGQSNVGIHLPEAVRAGEEVTVELSSLMYTQGETAQKVTVELAGATATADITPDFGPAGYGEAGTATVTLPVPADAAGQQVLRVTTDAGTDVTLPVEVSGGDSNDFLTGSAVGSSAGVFSVVAVVFGLIAAAAPLIADRVRPILGQFGIRI